MPCTETELMDQSEVRDHTYVPAESESDNESTNGSVHSSNIDLHANDAEYDTASQVEQDQAVNSDDQQAENKPLRKRSKKAQPKHLAAKQEEKSNGKGGALCRCQGSEIKKREDL